MAISSETVREFENKFGSFNISDFEYFTQTANDFEISSRFEQKLIYQLDKLLKRHEKEYEMNWKDPSVYTGTSGVALMYYHLYTNYTAADTTTRQGFLNKAVKIMQKTLKNQKNKAISFLCGDAGPLAVAAVVFKASGMVDEADKCAKNISSIATKLNNNGSKPDNEISNSDNDSEHPDELLYGKSGLLYTTIFLNNHLGNNTVSYDLIAMLCKLIIKSGREGAKDSDLPSPLMYKWHDKMYLGAAHGITGIIYILLNLTDIDYVSKHLSSHIQPTIQYLSTLKYPSGNYPSSIGSRDDKLVHWCHGAPGWLFMFLAAYQVFKDDSYLKAAKECGKVVWKRGLLRKGYGLCHGVSGNGYALLALYNATKDPKYLYYASKFAEWCLDYGNHGCRIADRPYSLFEGMAGTIHFLVDMLNPSEAKFPAFQL